MFKKSLICFILSLFFLATYMSCVPTVQTGNESSGENTSEGEEQNGGGGTNTDNVIHVTSVVVSKADSESELSEGETLQLIATVMPSNATNKNVIWFCSDTTKASVNSNGLVTAVAAGSVTITATSQENSEKYGSISITIIPAVNPVTGDFAYELSEDETYYIVKGIGTYTGTAINIPATYNSLPVKEIADKAFKANSTITSITIPESIIKIGDDAFYNCKNVTQIFYNAVNCEDFTTSNAPFTLGYDTTIKRICTIGNKVEKLPDYLFYAGYYQSNISSLIFEDNSSLKTIGTYIISNNIQLTELVIPATVQSIKKKAFSGLSAVESIKFYAENCVVEKDWFTNNVYGQEEKAINYYVGPDCTEIPAYFAKEKTIESINIDGAIKKIGAHAFYEAVFNGDFILPSTVTEIGTYAFHSAVFNGDFILPSAVTEVGTYAFYSSTFSEGTTITIPQGIKNIGVYAFYKVKNLQETLNLNSLETLGSCAFSDTNIKSIDFGDKLESIPGGVVTNTPVETIRIGKAVTSIKYDAFNSCPSIKKVMIYGNIADGEKNDYRQPILFNIDTQESYSKNIEIIIGSNVKRIPAYLFYNDSTKKEGRIGSITFEEAEDGEDEVPLSIGTYAFYSQNNLLSLETPSRCTSIEQYSFSNCSGMKQLTINAVTVIKYAFNGCSAENVSIGKTGNNIYLDGLRSLQTIYYNAENAEKFNAEYLGTSSSPVKLIIGKDTEIIPKNFMYHAGSYNPNSNYVSEVNFENDSKLKTINSGFLDECNTEQIHNLVLPESVENANIKNIDLNYLYVGKNVKTITAKVSKTVNGNVPYIDFNAEELSDRSGSTISQLLDCSSSTRIRIGKNVKYLPQDFLYRSTVDIVYFEKGSICSEMKTEAFREAKVNILVIPSSLQKVDDASFTFSKIANIYSEKDSNALNTITNWDSFFNRDINNATKYYYSSTNSSGKWHYDDDGVPVLW